MLGSPLPAAGVRAPAGLTLLELLVTLAVAAILTALATPSFHDLLVANRMAVRVNALATHLNLARAEAVRRDRQVVLCRSTDGAGCAGAGPWGGGWLMFLDVNHNEARDPGEPVLRVHGPLGGGLTLDYSGFPSGAYLAFHGTGTASGNGTFTFCDARGAAAAKAVIVSRTGRLRLSRRQADGSPLVC